MENREVARRSLIVCRCEEVTLGQLEDQIALGALTPEELKRFTRVSMGPCQGRVCRTLLHKAWLMLIGQAGETPEGVTQALGEGLGTAGLPLPTGGYLPGYRPPVRAVTVADIAALDISAPTSFKPSSSADR